MAQGNTIHSFLCPRVKMLFSRKLSNYRARTPHKKLNTSPSKTSPVHFRDGYIASQYYDLIIESFPQLFSWWKYLLYTKTASWNHQGKGDTIYCLHGPGIKMLLLMNTSSLQSPLYFPCFLITGQGHLLIKS